MPIKFDEIEAKFDLHKFSNPEEPMANELAMASFKSAFKLLLDRSKAEKWAAQHSNYNALARVEVIEIIREFLESEDEEDEPDLADRLKLEGLNYILGKVKLSGMVFVKRLSEICPDYFVSSERGIERILGLWPNLSPTYTPVRPSEFYLAFKYKIMDGTAKPKGSIFGGHQTLSFFGVECEPKENTFETLLLNLALITRQSAAVCELEFNKQPLRLANPVLKS